MMTEAESGLLVLAAKDLPPVRTGMASLSTKALQRRCDEYFALLDQPSPPECLLADYEEACEELRRRFAAGLSTMTGTAKSP